MLLLAWGLSGRLDAPPAGTLAYTPPERLEAIRGAWGDADALTVRGCPTVAALERLLPALRGIKAVERDYAGFLAGMDC